MIQFDFSKSFEENISDLVSSHNVKGKILRYSDNYYILESLYNQNYHDDYQNKCQRPNGTLIHNTVKRIWDLKNKYKIAGIKSEWVFTDGKKDHKRYWLSRKKEDEPTQYPIDKSGEVQNDI